MFLICSGKSYLSRKFPTLRSGDGENRIRSRSEDRAGDAGGVGRQSLAAAEARSRPQRREVSEDAELKRIRWRSRRGMRELDQMFDRYLEHGWPQDSEAQRAVFLRLLDCEDDKLWRWAMGYEDCSDAELAGLIERMRTLGH